jgi:REP element-mobilizing transposase RayT
MKGAVDRYHHTYKAPFAAPNERRFDHNRALLKGEPVELNAQRRSSVELSITETCLIRKWLLHAASVRTNHVHVVVSIGFKSPDVALNALKANATRQMRQDGGWTLPHSPWVDKGSKRNLWNECSVALAIDYAVNGQRDELPDLD